MSRNGNGNDDEHDTVIVTPPRQSNPGMRRDPMAELRDEVREYVRLSRIREERMTAQHAETRMQFAEAIERAMKAADVAAGKIDWVESALKDEIVPLVKDLDARLGKPPEKVDLSRASQTGEMTAAEITAAETTGTGLFAIVARQVAADIRAAQAAGRSAGRSAGLVTSVVTTAPVWVPFVVETAQKIFGG